MNAAEQIELAARLDMALTQAGIVIERADVVAGNIRGWAAIPTPALLGRFVQLGWRVRVTPPEDVIEIEEPKTTRHLELLK